MPPHEGRAILPARVKQTLVVAGVGSDAAPIRSSAANSARTYYYVENTGTNVGYFAWDEAFPSQTNRAIMLLPGDFREWAKVIPTQAANFASPLGTTFCVIEGWPLDG